MISKIEFETLINNLKEKLDETTVAMVSEELLATLAAYNDAYDEYDKNNEIINKLKEEKEELLKVNGKLYQRIGFDDVEKPSDKKDEMSSEDDEIKIEDVIDEKGELI